MILRSYRTWMSPADMNLFCWFCRVSAQAFADFLINRLAMTSLLVLDQKQATNSEERSNLTQNSKYDNKYNRMKSQINR